MRSRWIMLAVLFVARFALGVQFQTAGSVTPVIVGEFSAGYTGLGTLVGLYMLPGILLAIPAGLLAQRFGDRPVVLASLGMMVLGGAISGLAAEYGLLAAGRVIAGSGGVVLLIVLTKMLADWFTGHELFLGMAIYIIGWPVGIAAGQAIQPILADAAGWRWVLHSSTVLVLVSAFLIALLYRAPADAPAPGRITFVNFSRRELSLVTIAGLAWMFVNGAYLVLVSFGPVLLDQQSVPFDVASRVTSTMSWVFFFALPLGGYLATRYGMPRTVLTVGYVATVIIGALIPYTTVPLLTFTLFGIFYAAAAPVLGALPAQILAPENRATGMGIYYIWYFAGSALLPAAAGYLHEATGTAEGPVLFAVTMMVLTLMLAYTVYFAQRARPGTAGR